MTESLLQTVAVTTLDHAAFRVLTVLTIGARKPGMDPRKDNGRNGIQAITDSFARRFGITSRDTVYRALNELQERGLIVRTRDGHKSKTHFALYAVTWLPITHRDGQPLDVAEPALNTYLQWTPAPKVKKQVGHKLEMPSDGRTQSRPMNGHDESVCRPMVGRRKPICRPMVGNTLRVFQGDTTDQSTSDHAQGSNPPPIPAPLSQAAQSAKKLIDTLPHLTNAEVSKICRVELSDVQAAREANSQ